MVCVLILTLVTEEVEDESSLRFPYYCCTIENTSESFYDEEPTSF